MYIIHMIFLCISTGYFLINMIRTDGILDRMSVIHSMYYSAMIIGIRWFSSHHILKSHLMARFLIILLLIPISFPFSFSSNGLQEGPAYYLHFLPIQKRERKPHFLPIQKRSLSHDIDIDIPVESLPSSISLPRTDSLPSPFFPQHARPCQIIL